jgi:indolepyruvate ferredoxin oxidoreductase
VFRLLAAMRKLRGTRLDLFGRTTERRLERRLIEDFEATVGTVLQHLDADNIGLATEIVDLFMEIRGYGPVKQQAAARIRPQIAGQLAEFTCTRRKAA